jgi:EAL domain-containing protein (putative c-di-GMP-specific phosphodiesterase class I)
MIKIDKQFISNINSKYKSKVICQSIIEMAKKLQIDVIAEGVETKEQFETLVDMKCDNIQGYYISRPLAKKELIEFLNVN